MIDLSGYMQKLAKAIDSDSHNQVFVYREVLTKIYLEGHEDGMRAARKDEFERQQIEAAAAEREAQR